MKCNGQSLHERSPAHMTRDELLELVKWQDKALQQMLATIRRLNETKETV